MGASALNEQRLGAAGALSTALIYGANLYSNEPGFTRELVMPDGVTIEAVLPAEEGIDPSQPRRILFLPGATVPAIAIQLANRRNAHRRIRLDPMTGFPRVENVVTQ